MTNPTMPLIAEYLADRPRGARLAEIVTFLDSTIESVDQSMIRMERRGQVEREPAAMRADVVWKLKRIETTPPVFRAMQTLVAMQTAARQIYAVRC